MSYAGSQPPGGYPPPPGGYPPQGGYAPGYPPQNYQQPGGYQPGGYGAPPMPAYASFGKRIAAWALDALIGLVATIPGWVLFGIGIAIAASSADSRGNLSQDSAGAAFGLMALAYIAILIGALGFGIYNIYLLGKTGSTLGKRWMKIKVLDPLGQPLGFWKAFARELVKGLIGNVCLILYFWPMWDQEQQGLYDKLFSTHVYEA